MTDIASATLEQRGGSGRGCLMVLGVLNIVFGFIAIGSPWILGAAAMVVIGIMLLVSGIVELVHAFTTGGGKSGVIAFLGGALAVVGGGIILARPLYAMALLTLILAIYFVVDGIVRSVWAFKARPASGWGWVLFGGVVTVLLGLMIWRQWPSSALWAIGLLVGIRILMAGWAMLFLGMAAGHVESGTPTVGKET